MRNRYLLLMFLLMPVWAAAQTGGTNGATKASYPATRTVDVTDDYHGTRVADPYRWLEVDTAADVAAWVQAQNQVTFAYLDRIPYREAMRKRMEALYNYPKLSQPYQVKDYLFFRKNNGLQNQSVLYWQRGLSGTPQVLLDPNTWSADGTTRLLATAPSRTVKYLAYSISQAGSDWQEIRVLDPHSGKLLDERLQYVKFSGISWQGDEGFYYSRYPEPTPGTQLTGVNTNMQVYYHKVGTPQSADVLVHQDPEHPKRLFGAGVSDDDRFLFLTLRDGSASGNALWVKNLAKGDAQWTPIWNESDNILSPVDNVGDKLLVYTNRKAPNGRLVLIDPANPAEANWRDVLPHRANEVLADVSTGGGKLFVTYQKDVVFRAYVYSLDGKLENEVPLPGLGSIGGFGGERDAKFVFYTYTSYNTPTTIYRYDIATRKSELFNQPEVAFDPAQFEVKQLFAKSKDGTRVPMFVVHKKGLKLNGDNPTWLYAYGGFNSGIYPGFNALLVPWLENGGVYVAVNLRGGDEYGEQWHRAGTKERKQNVFDDFVAAAEHLVAQKYTNPGKLAMSGGSNGGLLVGAVMTQRPELFRVALPAVGVMDMLRFHKFTIGYAWVDDYGSSDTPEGFAYLYKYSPYHNLKPGTQYPATLITTADHDDRVVPGHSFKFAARLQACQAGPAPVLIRIETNSGHGASSTSKAIATYADQVAFVMYNLGMQPKL